MQKPLISIVIPARNEAADIAATLDRCLALDYDHKEIIVVDDSTDETPKIVASYSDRGVRLVHREKNSNGCCGARNLGMQLANGEIIVILNADNRPRTDFLRRLLLHYQEGADYVIVRSTVLNTETLWGKFTQAAGLAYMSGEPQLEWSEGFSCRKESAAKVGYIPGDFPIPFCRDAKIGFAMHDAGYMKHVDLDLPMEHVVPGTLVDYWRNQVWRGTFSAPHSHYFRNMPVPIICIREGLKLMRTLLEYLLIVPAVWKAFKIARYTRHVLSDAPGMLLAGFIQDFALRVGNFKGLMRLMTVLGQSNSDALSMQIDEIDSSHFPEVK